MEVAQAFALIEKAIDAGRAAHGYLLVGNLSGSCEELATLIFHKLFPEGHDLRQHPDVAWLLPTGAKRVITVEDMREKIVEPMASTSYSGSWKMGIISGADRLNGNSANAFLKSLEEPTPKTLYLLLTDQPDGILPTIISRSQRIDLPLAEECIDGAFLNALTSAFYNRDAGALAKVLDKIEDSVESDEVQIVRKRFFKTMMSIARKWMEESSVPRHLAFRNLDAVEDAYRRVTERSMNAEAVLSLMLDLFTFPKA